MCNLTDSVVIFLYSSPSGDTSSSPGSYALSVTDLNCRFLKKARHSEQDAYYLATMAVKSGHLL